MAGSGLSGPAPQVALPPTTTGLPALRSTRVEDLPWAEPWARVTRALSHAVATPARELSWKGTARQFAVNGKSVAAMVRRAVPYGLRNRKRPPVHIIGIDEVSRRTYLLLVAYGPSR